MNASVFFVKRRVRELSRQPEPITSPILHRGTRGVPRPADPLYPGRPTPSAGDDSSTVAHLGRGFRLHLGKSRLVIAAYGSFGYRSSKEGAGSAQVSRAAGCPSKA